VTDLTGQFKIFYSENLHHSCGSTGVLRAMKSMSLQSGRTTGKEILPNFGQKFLVTWSLRKRTYIVLNLTSKQYYDHRK
jgi:hypothetical protein